ncbi:MAG: sugar phosphate isomerase/epimerase [Verrucomicrobia bacterium]|nr:sugar phosphate isomerase/epimerase [Verrucomicrobiota bacterium]
MITRRIFLKGTLAGLASGMAMSRVAVEAAAPAAGPRLRISSCRVGLEEGKQAGLDGVEIEVGPPADRLRIADPAARQRYKEQMVGTGLVISSFMMGLLNSAPLASDPRAPAWLEQSIDAAKDLGAGVILVAFFGKGNLLAGDQVKQGDVDVVVERLKAAAPRAKAAGVVLAIENTLSAKQNADLLERIGHDSVRVYYDVGNLTARGYDVPAEIRFLKDRIACFHFKDRDRYLGEGQIQFEPIAAAIREIGYGGWIVMETANPSKNAMADAKRNAAFIRRLFGNG